MSSCQQRHPDFFQKPSFYPQAEVRFTVAAHQVYTRAHVQVFATLMKGESGLKLTGGYTAVPSLIVTWECIAISMQSYTDLSGQVEKLVGFMPFCAWCGCTECLECPHPDGTAAVWSDCVALIPGGCLVAIQLACCRVSLALWAVWECLL